MKRTRIAIAALLLGSAPALAAQNSFVGEYSVSFLGLPIARATFNSSYDGDKYTINGNVASSGLAKLFDDTNGSLTARGTLGDKHPVPSSFHAGYTYGSKASSIDIRFKDGNVVSTKVVPKPRGRGDDWVKLGAENLVKVVDPIASTVLRARSIDEVCGRTVKMYDGEMRANLSLSQVSRQTMSVQGFDGETVTCRMAFEPVAGYRKGRKALDYLKNRADINVTFAQLGQTGIYAPTYATVGTQIGTITIKARRFEASAN